MRNANSEQHTSRPLLATDLDGTLIPLENHPRNQEDLKLLSQELAKRQVELVFVTGRHLESVESAIAQYDLPVPNWIISDVGTSIYQRSAETYQLNLPYSDHLAELCQALSLEELKRNFHDTPSLRLQEEEKQGAYKLSYYVDQSELTKATKLVSRKLDQLQAPWSLIDSVDPFNGDGLLDLLPQNVSKAYALRWWANHVGGSPDQLVFAGDSGNDFAALTAGFRAILVGNASRDLADRVQSTHDQFGWKDRLFLAKDHSTSGVLCRLPSL